MITLSRLQLWLLLFALITSSSLGGCTSRPPRLVPVPVVTPGSPAPASSTPPPPTITGPTEQPDQSVLPATRELGPGRLAVGPLRNSSQTCLSPDGRNIMVVTDDGGSLAIFPTGNAGGGRVVLTWHYGGPVYNESEWDSVRSRVTPVGWADENRVLFLAGDAGPGGGDGLWGLALWQVDIRSAKAERLSWIGPLRYIDSPQTRWVTADGRAAVVQCRDDQSRTVFTVVDLRTGAARTASAQIPVYDPSAQSMFERSPDGWSVVWQEQSGGWEPSAGRAMLMDLRTGDARTIYRTGDGGLMAGLSWSPDGRRVALFAAYAGDKYGLIHGEDWVTFMASRCTVVGLDGSPAGEFFFPGHTWYPRISWAAGGSTLCLVQADTVKMVQPDEWGNDTTLQPGVVYLGSLAEHSAVRLDEQGPASPGGIPWVTFLDGERLAISRYDGSATVTRIYSVGDTTAIDIGDRQPLLVDDQSVASAGGWLVTRGSHGLLRVSASGELTALIDESWFVFGDYGEVCAGVLKLNGNSGSGQFVITLPLGEH